MLKPKRADRLIHCLICWGCHGRMGPNHYTLMDGGAVCNICGSANPLGNLRKLTMLDLTEPREIWVPWTQSGTAAHALSSEGRTSLGPWIKFASAETFERALIYIGMTDQPLTDHRRGIFRQETDSLGTTAIQGYPHSHLDLFTHDP
jgi:hypothetical protein